MDSYNDDHRLNLLCVDSDAAQCINSNLVLNARRRLRQLVLWQPGNREVEGIRWIYFNSLAGITIAMLIGWLGFTIRQITK